MKTNTNYKILTSFLIFLSFLSYVVGFYFNENSSGAGDYRGDITIIWSNLQIWINNDIISSIHHEDYYGSRTPLVYLLHKILNPFTDNIENYRKSVFVFSLTLPILFYFSLKEKFVTEDKLLILLISSTICLSPYFRTSAYWGLEENFGSVFMLLSFLLLNNFLKINNSKTNKVHLILFLTTLCSSFCLYFDQKLIIIPLICFIKIILSDKLFKFKLISVVYYLLLSLPFIYLIFVWGGLVPAKMNDPVSGRQLGREIFLIHIGYACTIIAFYLTPLLLFKEKNLFLLIKNFFSNRSSFFFILPFVAYIICMVVFFDFNNQSQIGKGFIHKTSLLLFSNDILKIIYVYFAFFISWLIILIFIEKQLVDILTISYLLILSVIIWPIFQEYFDPLILIMAFIFFGTKLHINYKNSIALYAYFLVFLVGTNIYYFKLLG